MKWEFVRVNQSYKEVWVTYIHPDGHVTPTPSWKSTQKNDPVFEGILGYLGGREWELISVVYESFSTGTIDPNVVRAFLKRPVVDGRPTDQPPIPSNLWS